MEREVALTEAFTSFVQAQLPEEMAWMRAKGLSFAAPSRPGKRRLESDEQTAAERRRTMRPRRNRTGEQASRFFDEPSGLKGRAQSGIMAGVPKVDSNAMPVGTKPAAPVAVSAAPPPPSAPAADGGEDEDGDDSQGEEASPSSPEDPTIVMNQKADDQLTSSRAADEPVVA